MTFGFPDLPAVPLARALGRVLDPNEGLEEACAAFGVSSKSLYEWRNGVRDRVRFDTADRILGLAYLNWWEVWTPENTEPGEYEQIRLAFEGDDLPLPPPAPLPLTMTKAIERAAYLRKKDPGMYTYRTLADVMAEYHGIVRVADWWRQTLVRGGHAPARAKNTNCLPQLVKYNQRRVTA